MKMENLLVKELVNDLFTQDCCFTKKQMYREYESQIKEHDCKYLVRYLWMIYDDTQNEKYLDYIDKVKSAAGVEDIIEEIDLELGIDIAAYVIDIRKPYGRYILQDGDKYIGIDNRTGDAWTEEFDTKDECERWLNDEFEMSDKAE